MSIKVINNFQVAKSSGPFLGVTLLDLPGPCDIFINSLKNIPHSAVETLSSPGLCLAVWPLLPSPLC